MKTARVGFGACFARNKAFVVVSGGFSDGFKATSKAEVYDVKADAWREAKPLTVSRTAHSMCEMGAGAYIYAFGGQDATSKNIDSIERTEITGAASLESAMGAWQVLGDIKLRAALCNIGCFPVSRNEVLLFGGIDS